MVLCNKPSDVPGYVSGGKKKHISLLINYQQSQAKNTREIMGNLYFLANGKSQGLQ